VQGAGGSIHLNESACTTASGLPQLIAAARLDAQVVVVSCLPTCREEVLAMAEPAQRNLAIRELGKFTAEQRL